jgi:2-hydroxymuconate-semialdehyde hydrolase
VVAPDVPGLGEFAPAPYLKVDTFARWLRDVVAETGLERPTLAAHSLVGSLAARFAARRTDLIDQLVVSAAPAIGPYRMPNRLRYVAVRFAIRPTARNAERFDRFVLLDLDATRRRDPVWFDAFVAYTRARALVPHVKKTMRNLFVTQTKPIADPELDRMVIPTTLLRGRHDRMVPRTVGQAAATRHHWPLRVIDDARPRPPHRTTPKHSSKPSPQTSQRPDR